MATYVGHTARQRELEKLYNKLCGRYSRHEVWQDMVVMIACAIANAVDKRHFDEREAMYMRIVPKYSKEELDIFPEFFTHIVLGMEESPDCDFLGELYMNLDLGNKHAGQFFTPYSVCQFMAECSIQDDLLEEQIKKHGWISINDCACGAGATLVAAANYLRSRKINYQQQALFVAQDVDMTVGLMCYIQLSLLGCAGYVVIGNTITEPQVGPVLFGEDSSRCWFTPMYFHAIWETRRAIAMARMMFQRVATALPDEATDQPKANMHDKAAAPVGPAGPARGRTADGKIEDFDTAPPESAGMAPEEPTSAPASDPEPERTPTLTISTGKKNAGQIMFDFG